MDVPALKISGGTLHLSKTYFMLVFFCIRAGFYVKRALEALFFVHAGFDKIVRFEIMFERELCTLVTAA